MRRPGARWAPGLSLGTPVSRATCMPETTVEPSSPDLLAHGAEVLSLVTVDAYNAELRTPEGFVGDRASKRAFQAILDDWRERQ
jgi:hypothetical protein